MPDAWWLMSSIYLVFAGRIIVSSSAPRVNQCFLTAFFTCVKSLYVLLWTAFGLRERLQSVGTFKSLEISFLHTAGFWWVHESSAGWSWGGFSETEDAETSGANHAEGGQHHTDASSEVTKSHYLGWNFFLTNLHNQEPCTSNCIGNKVISGSSWQSEAQWLALCWDAFQCEYGWLIL